MNSGSILEMHLCFRHAIDGTRTRLLGSIRTIVSRAECVQNDDQAKKNRDAHADYSRGKLLFRVPPLTGSESLYVFHVRRFH